MTTVSIYDDIDPGVKRESGPVDLYGQLQVTNNNNSAPTNSYRVKQNHSNITNTRVTPVLPPHAHNLPRPHITSIHAPHPAAISKTTIINHSPNQVYPHENVDPSLVGIPMHQQANYRSHVLYVGGLSWWISDADLRGLFEQFGDIIQIKIHADKVNGKSKGYGYVEYAQRDTEGAVTAKQKLHGHILSECRIVVAFSSPDRINGVEYSNTPVHIPRKRNMHNMHMNRHIRPLLGPPRSAVMPTVIPGGIPGRSGHHSNHRNGHNMPIKTEGGGNNQKPGGGMGILSQITNQEQLLELLKKAQSRSASEDSDSRSRSRSRSRGKRRRRHKKRDRERRRGRDSKERSGGEDVVKREKREGREVKRERRSDKEREERRHKRRHRHRDRDRHHRDRDRGRKSRSDEAKPNTTTLTGITTTSLK